MKTWNTSALRRKCGGCGAEIDACTLACLVSFPSGQKPKVRCLRCEPQTVSAPAVAEKDLPSFESLGLVFRGGPRVDLDAVNVYAALRGRGIALTVKDGALVGPQAQMTADEIQSVKRHKAALVPLVAYLATQEAQ